MREAGLEIADRDADALRAKVERQHSPAGGVSSFEFRVSSFRVAGRQAFNWKLATGNW
jgi:hypothetical protein